MSGGIRELLRAAQEAEVRGDFASAVERLREAAVLYDEAGKRTRALAMLRHAQRLDPSRSDLGEGIRQLESSDAEVPSGPSPLQQQMDAVLAEGRPGTPEEGLPGENNRTLVERGPTLAHASVAAWCSFCCRPGAELGPLVAGPAGAFVCGRCLLEAARLLEGAGGHGAFAFSQASRVDLPASSPSAGTAGGDGASQPARGLVRGATDVESQDDLVAQADASRLQHVPSQASSGVLRELRMRALVERESGRADSGYVAVDVGTGFDVQRDGGNSGRTGEAVVASSRAGDVVSRAVSGQEPPDDRTRALPPERVSVEDVPQLVRTRDALLQAIDSGGRRVLLIGPAGAGKSAVLEDVARKRDGFFFSIATAPRSLPGEWLLILEVPQATDPSEWGAALALLDRHPGRAILAVRGQPMKGGITLRAAERTLTVPSTAALMTATADALPQVLVEQVDAVVELDALDVNALTTLAERMLRTRGFAAPFVRQTAGMVAKLAYASGRGIHEVHALVRRIPDGKWVGARPVSGKRKKAR